MSKEITVRNLNAWFGKIQAIHSINLHIPKNQVTAIIGPSGCGKSTFLRCINRMHEVTPGARAEGEILLDDQNVYGAEMDAVILRRHIGMVFQRPNPFPTMTIADNVAAGLKLNGIRKSDIAGTVEKALRMAALWDEVKDILGKPGNSLSGGQQQRLCIARALAVEPDVLLMDEPCSALDPLATARIEELVLSLKEKYTIVIVTHNMQQAARVSDWTAYFYLGKLIEYGDTKTIFTTPARKETEDYITGRFG